MNRKIYCACDSDFTNHFQQQAGSGLSDLNVYRGHPYQRGFGIGSTILKFGLPVLKFLGKQFIKTGVNVGSDFLSGNSFKNSIKSRGKEGIRNVAKQGLNKLHDLIDQSGSGIRKRKKRSKPKQLKRIKRDIFS